MENPYPATDSQKKQLAQAPRPQCGLHHDDCSTLYHLAGVVVYLWLTNGRECWYLVHTVRAEVLIGDALEDGWWRPMPIDCRLIEKYY